MPGSRVTSKNLDAKVEQIHAGLTRDIKDLDARVEQIRADTKRDIEEVRADLKRDIEELRADLRRDLKDLETKVFREMKNLEYRKLGTLMVVAIGAMATLAKLCDLGKVMKTRVSHPRT